MKTIITFGTFDLFHIGHLNILRRARNLGSSLVVGVSSDSLNLSKKGSYPTYNENDRIEIVSAIKYVDSVFLEESLEKKADYILEFKADILVMGDDWTGKFDWVSDVCQVTYLPRTKNISTTEIRQDIRRI